MNEHFSSADLRHIAEDLVEDLRECENGISLTTCQLLMLTGYDINKFTDDELFDLDSFLHRAAKANEITLDISAHEGKVEGLPFNLDFVVHNKRAQIKCPHCGSTDTARYVYGKDATSDQAEEMVATGKWVLGKSSVVENAPSRTCNKCKKDFGAAPILISEDEGPVDLRDIVTSVEFSIGGYFGGFTIITITKNDDGAIVKVDKTTPPKNDEDIKKWLGTRKITPSRWRRIVLALYDRMYLNDWDDNYVDPHVMDGTQWHLEIGFADGKSHTYGGSNAFPVYWSDMRAVFRRFVKASWL